MLQKNYFVLRGRGFFWGVAFFSNTDLLHFFYIKNQPIRINSIWTSFWKRVLLKPRALFSKAHWTPFSDGIPLLSEGIAQPSLVAAWSVLMVFERRLGNLTSSLGRAATQWSDLLHFTVRWQKVTVLEKRLELPCPLEVSPVVLG